MSTMQFQHIPIGILEIVVEDVEDPSIYITPFSREVSTLLYNFLVKEYACRPFLITTYHGLFSFCAQNHILRSISPRDMFETYRYHNHHDSDELCSVLRIAEDISYQVRRECMFVESIDIRTNVYPPNLEEYIEGMNAIYSFLKSKGSKYTREMKKKLFDDYNDLMTYLKEYVIEEFLHYAYMNNMWCEVCDKLEHAIMLISGSKILGKFGWHRYNNLVKSIDPFSLPTMKRDVEPVLIQEVIVESTPSTSTQVLTTSIGRAVPECAVCLDKGVCVLFGPCDHICVCEVCANALLKSGQPCPVCKGSIQTMKRVIFS